MQTFESHVLCNHFIVLALRFIYEVFFQRFFACGLVIYMTVKIYYKLQKNVLKF